MRIRVTKKLAQCIDGVDVSRFHVGDVVDLPRYQAELLLAEGWAVPQAYRAKPRQLSIRLVGRSKGAGTASDVSGHVVRTIERLREIRAQMDQRRFAQQERRRTEDWIREELHDERSTTVRGSRG